MFKRVFVWTIAALCSQATLTAAAAVVMQDQPVAAKREQPMSLSGAHLQVQCSPPECEVSVHDRVHGTTRRGTLRFSHLQPGEVFVNFKKDGYEGQQIFPILLLPGFLIKIEAKLTPNGATQLQFGQELFSRMVDALGGDEGVKTASSLVGDAEIAFSDPDGKTSFEATGWRLRLPDLIEFRSQKGAMNNFSISLLRGAGAAIKGTPPAGIEKSGPLYREFQPAAVIMRIRADGFKLLAKTNKPVEGQPMVLEANHGEEKFFIKLGDDFLPIALSHEPGSTVGSQTDASYAGYKRIGSAQYPTRILLGFNPKSREGALYTIARVHQDARH